MNEMKTSEKKRAAKQIFAIRKSLNMTQAEFAKAIDDIQSNVSKWERAAVMPSPPVLFRIAQLVGKSVDEVFSSNAQPDMPGRRIRVIGELAAGSFREAVEWQHDDQFDVPVVLPSRYDATPLQGFVVRGESMNLLYPDGTIVYVAPLHAIAEAPKNGQVVMVMRRDSNGLTEATLKEFVVDEAGKKWLWPRSRAPEHQAPISYLGPRRGKVEEVIVTGVVVAALIYPTV
jgi:transcriptional regulator with XRE-family HTH domain